MALVMCWPKQYKCAVLEWLGYSSYLSELLHLKLLPSKNQFFIIDVVLPQKNKLFCYDVNDIGKVSLIPNCLLVLFK